MIVIIIIHKTKCIMHNHAEMERQTVNPSYTSVSIENMMMMMMMMMMMINKKNDDDNDNDNNDG